RREQRLARIVEAEKVAVLGEELADRDVALLRGHRLGRDFAALLFLLRFSAAALAGRVARCAGFQLELDRGRRGRSVDDVRWLAAGGRGQRLARLPALGCP